MNLDTVTEDSNLAEKLVPNLGCDNEWIRGHYHCRICGGEIECWKAFPWGTAKGVKRLGGCKTCGQLMMEYENAKPVWIEVPL